jgi:hypothetical protein
MATETEIRLKPLLPEPMAPEMPPKPPDFPLGAPLVLRPPVNPDATGIKKVLMILGIIAGFMFYVVPGIFAIRTYRYWRRGEAPTPIGWMLFGGAMTAWVVFWIVLAIVSPDSFGL